VGTGIGVRVFTAWAICTEAKLRTELPTSSEMAIIAGEQGAFPKIYLFAAIRATD
jgi:hypothetical protein